jgi:hypothetical protein
MGYSTDRSTNQIYQDQTKRRNLMNTQKNQKAFTNVLGTIGFWLGLGILLLVAALAINTISRKEAVVPVTGSSSRSQSVPDAAAQGVAGYIDAHSDPAAQAVPDAAVQSVTDYLHAHGIGPIITDRAQESVVDYLRAHGAEVP